MHKLFSLTLAFSLSVGLAAAQTPDSTTYKHQLGLTASPQLDKFFMANRSLPIGLVYKRQVKPNQALRARVEVLYNYLEQVAPISVREGASGGAFRQTDYRVEAAIGKEYLLPLTKRFTGYAGLEIGAFYAPSEREFETYTSSYQAIGPDGPYRLPVVDIGRTSFNASGVLVQPLAGLRYHLHRRLYAEAEALLPIRWSRTRFFLNSRVTDFDTNTLGFGSNRGEDTYYGLNVNFRPISALHLVFLF